MPTPKQLRSVARWLATCMTCGVEHEERPVGRNRRETTWAGKDGHVYRPRIYVLAAVDGSRGVVSGMRAEAKRMDDADE
jgi:hypothetical protein